MRKIFLVIVVNGASVHSQSNENLLEQIGWKGATANIIISLMVTLMALLILLILLHVRAQIKLKNDVKRISEKQYDEYCENAGLLPHEKAKLEKLIKHEYIEYRHTIFQSAGLFERCMDAEVRLLLLTNNNEENIVEEENLLSMVRKKMGYSYLSLEHPLLSSRNIETGQAVTVFTINGKTPIVENAMISINRETHFAVHYKVEKNKAVPFTVGQELRVAFARQGDAIYGIKTEICSIEKESTLHCLHTMQFQRNQLRQFVRIPVNLPLRIKILSANKDGKKEPFSKSIEVKLADISGGGLSFTHTVPYAAGEKLSLCFTLSTGKFTGIEGKILRVSLIEGKNENIYRHHVQFAAIESSLRDRIVRFIFEKQREQNQIR